MDCHIHNFIYETNDEDEKDDKIISPAQAYNDFCMKNRELLYSEIVEYRKRVLNEQQVNQLLNNDKKDERLNPDILSEKFKKTYKNRFYTISKESKQMEKIELL